MPLIKTLGDTKNVTIRICAPGDYGKSPWTLSRGRQDITEELYVDVWFPGDTALIAKYAGPAYVPLSNFTTSCSTTTTRGYFELPNYRNDYLAQPLEDQWPDNETMGSEWNDYIWKNGYTVPSAMYVPLTCPRKCRTATRDARFTRAKVSIRLHEEGQEQEFDADSRIATSAPIQISEEVQKVQTLSEHGVF